MGFIDYVQSLKPNLSINPVRVLQDGNLVSIQSEYDLGGKNIVFDLFRFENGKVVEHWDVIQEVPTEMAHENGMF